MITKEIVIDKIEILEDGTIQIREKTRFIEDDVTLSESNTDRRILYPGCDVSSEPVNIQALASLIHTPEKIAAYEALIALNTPETAGE
jgi:hypothetical protein